MLDPMQAYHLSAQTPAQGYQDLDEEQLAQRHGHVVAAGRPVLNQVSVRVGKLLIRVGERLAAENAQIEFHKEAA